MNLADDRRRVGIHAVLLLESLDFFRRVGVLRIGARDPQRPFDGHFPIAERSIVENLRLFVLFEINESTNDAVNVFIRQLDPLRGLFETTIKDKRYIVEYEPDVDLRDVEQVPLTETGGIEAFIKREVLPHAPDAWFDEDATKIGYEISFNRYFYKPQPLRSLDEIRKDILALEQETEGLLKEVVGGSV
jgi:hypothetical protein